MRANDLAPANTDYLFNLGYAHALAQNAPAALQWLREAVRFDAANGDAHLVMSGVLASTGRPTEAQRELDLARLLGTRLDAGARGDVLPHPARPRAPRRRSRRRRRAAVVGALATPAQRDQRETALFHLARAERS